MQGDLSTITNRLEQRHHSASLNPFTNFQGQISIGKFSLPIQKFSFRDEGKILTIENFPLNSFPKIEIVLEKTLVVKVKRFNIFHSDRSTLGEILYTRLYLSLINERNCSINFTDVNLPSLNFSLSEFSLEETEQMFYRAKFSRKLGFIEDFFGILFNLPENISSGEAQLTEILFNGLTKGNFTVPSDSLITIYNYKVSKDDVKNDFLFARRQFDVEFNEKFFLLGRFFDIGKISVSIKKASVANPQKLKPIKENETINELRLNVFDAQIHYFFEKYNNTNRLLKNKEKLKRFKDKLQNDEPNFLASLVDESLAEVSAKSAMEILESLMQYHDFPDRFTALKPELQNNKWKVPIALTYPKHEPILLTSAYVNVKTGKVDMEISFEELLRKGKKKAKEAFSIA